MPAPTKHPDWATDGGPNVVEPPSGKVAAGWVPGEQPPSGWFNWWQALVGQWTRWLESQIAALFTRADELDAHVALTDRTNTFTFPQIINADADNPDTPLLSTTQLPGDYTPTPTNRWKLELAFPSSATVWAGFYVGQGADRFAIAHNARWHLPTQRWRQLDAAIGSFALVCRDDKFIMSRVAAGTAPWSNWPQTDSADFYAGDIYAGDTASAAVYAYPTPTPTRTTIIPLSYAIGGKRIAGDLYFVADPPEIIIPIKLPAGAILAMAEVMVYKAAAGGTLSATLYRKTYTWNGASSGHTWTAIGSDSVANAPINWSVLAPVTVNAPGGDDERLISEAMNYDLHVIGGTTADFVAGVRVTWSDPGPRNH